MPPKSQHYLLKSQLTNDEVASTRLDNQQSCSAIELLTWRFKISLHLQTCMAVYLFQAICYSLFEVQHNIHNEVCDCENIDSNNVELS